MKTINENNFRKLSSQQLGETKGGAEQATYIIIIGPDGKRYKVYY
ncbi:hypothetical protein SDC9_97001 [bioreactor metagenome]|uniref:Uncharacterized protein n=1 Tax=bioreactor metagenome TaxID=1076179 RepID=A0A645AAN0_9ZZZZ|nr:hypothetical protein [Paludibacter sp.]